MKTKFHYFFLALALAVSSARADNLFVTVNVEGAILEYNTGIGASSQSLFASNIYGSSLLGLAVDTSGNVFASVLNSSSDYGYIYKFTPDGIQSTWASGLDPNCLVFDPSGNLVAPGYTYSGAKVIYEITPGGSRSTFYNGLGGVDGAFDAETNLFIATGGLGSIYKLTPGGGTSVFASGFSSSYGLAFDRQGSLFMSDFMAGTVYKFTSSGGVLSSTPAIFATGFNSPRGLAFDSAGNLFMVDQNAYLIYEFTNSGGVLSANATVFASLDGSGYPAYLAFAPALPPPPALSIAVPSANSLVLTWPGTGSYTVQTNSDLNSANWIPDGAAVTSANGTNRLSLTPPASGNLFFRLSRP